MSKAIGMIEYRTVSAGITATDLMVKTADVDIIEAQTVCPGKYISIITGDLSAVRAAVDNAKASFEEAHIDSFVLGNPDESIFPAIMGTTTVTQNDVNSLGIIETFDASQIIVAADNAVKTASVSAASAPAAVAGPLPAPDTASLPDDDSADYLSLG